MSEITPTSPSEPATEYTQEQYEAYLQYQEDQKRLACSQQSPAAPPVAWTSPGTDLANGSAVTPTVWPVSGNEPAKGSTSAPAAWPVVGGPTAAPAAWPVPGTETVKVKAPETAKDSAMDNAKETAKETASAAKDTAAAMFGEVKSAVSVASKREPYAFLALASAAFTLVWLVWREDDEFGAEKLKLWTIFVLASVALLFTPIVKKVFRLDALRAWQFAVGGASGLGFAWVAFLLPNIDSNQAFFGTLAVAAGGLAAWTAPGRPA
jgi:hypothetical protein